MLTYLEQERQVLQPQEPVLQGVAAHTVALSLHREACGKSGKAKNSSHTT